MTGKIVATGWATQMPSGHVLVDVHPAATEASAWHRALWNSDPQEIAEAKRRGARAFRVRVVEMEGE